MIHKNKQKIFLCLIFVTFGIILAGCFGATSHNENEMAQKKDAVNSKDESEVITIKPDYNKELKVNENLKPKMKANNKEEEPLKDTVSDGEAEEKVDNAPINHSGKYIVGYYPSWASSEGFYPANVDATKLTHINYAFANVSADNKIAMNNPNIDLSNFDGLRKLRQINPSLKLSISIGGWDGSKYFSNAVLTEASRETFASSCAEFINEHGFDGIDLDWEYPVSGGFSEIINRKEDKQNFTKFIKLLRKKLNELSSKNQKQYFLSIAGAPSAEYINKIELTEILPYLDYIFIMGYDVHGPWDKYSDFNAPLYTPQEDSPQYSGSINDAINAYINSGAPASKLVLGMPFYGYKYNIDGGDYGRLFAPFSSATSIGYDKIKNGYLNNPAYEKLHHPDADVPYILGDGVFISYEDVNSVISKVNLAKSFGLGGIGAWALSHDKDATLLGNAYSALYS